MIVEGLQKVQPGAPVDATEASAAAPQAARRRPANSVPMARFFIDRPIFAWVLAIIVMIAR